VPERPRDGERGCSTKGEEHDDAPHLVRILLRHTLASLGSGHRKRRSNSVEVARHKVPVPFHRERR
jgi:hypothetical protein